MTIIHERLPCRKIPVTALAAAACHTITLSSHHAITIGRGSAPATSHVSFRNTLARRKSAEHQFFTTPASRGPRLGQYVTVTFHGHGFPGDWL